MITKYTTLIPSAFSCPHVYKRVRDDSLYRMLDECPLTSAGVESHNLPEHSTRKQLSSSWR